MHDEPIGTFCLVLPAHLPWPARHASWPADAEPDRGAAGQHERPAAFAAQDDLLGGLDARRLGVGARVPAGVR